MIMKEILSQALSLAQWIRCVSTFSEQIYPEVCVDDVKMPASLFSVIVLFCTGDWTVVLELLDLLGVDYKVFKVIGVVVTVINVSVCFHTGDYIGGIKQFLLIDWHTLWSILTNLQKSLKKEWPN